MTLRMPAYAAVLLLSGCASMSEIQPIAVRYTQSDYKKVMETATTPLNVDTQTDQSPMRAQILHENGLKFRLSGNTVVRGNASVRLTYQCDFSKGPTHGSALIGFQPAYPDPWGPPQNIASQAEIHVQCIPMSSAQRELQIAKDRARQAAAEALARQEQAAAAQRQAEEQHQALAQKQAHDAAQADRAARLAAEQTPAYKRARAIDEIRRDTLVIRRNQALMQREWQVGATSGFVDKEALHEAGEMIVSAQRWRAENWRLYKSLGGKATSIDQLLRITSTGAAH